METKITKQRVPLPRPEKDFNTAKRLYMEQFASALVTNNYLRSPLPVRDSSTPGSSG